VARRLPPESSATAPVTLALVGEDPKQIIGDLGDGHTPELEFARITAPSPVSGSAKTLYSTVSLNGTYGYQCLAAHPVSTLVE